MDSEALLETAVEEGVAYVAGRPFFVDGSGRSSMRLTFAKEDIPIILEGVKRLARAIRFRAAG
jgi:2-aminoadipate transaminase